VDGDEEPMTLKRLVAEFYELKEEMSRITRHKTAYTSSIPIPLDEHEETELWKHTIDESILSMSTGHVDSLLEKKGHCW
jgi:hypothetical protein